MMEQPFRDRRDAFLRKILRRSAVMGILNVTPDSFFDGGQFQTIEAATTHARKLVADGRFGPGKIQTSTRENVALLTSPMGGDAAGGPAVGAVRDLRANIIPSIFGNSGAGFPLTRGAVTRRSRPG